MLEDVKRAFSSHSLLIGDDGCMKANRKFIEKEAGVSAVIGVILMVAITVAIAATVYVYVSGMIGVAPEKTPTIVFQQSDADDYLMVTGTGGQKDLDWENVVITVIGTCDFINVSWDTSMTSGDNCPAGDITAADRITFDGFNESIEVTMVWEPTNGLMGSWTFT